MANILLVISGSIAAYKAPTLCNRLQQQGHQVRIILTDAASEIITELALQSVCKQHVYRNHEASRKTQPMLHIDIAKWAQVMLIAPASANQLARLAHGLADDLISSCYLATCAHVMFAPAMNYYMWQHPATQHNLQQLQQRNQEIIAPAIGLQACGDQGAGRMSDIEHITQAVQQHLLHHVKPNNGNTKTEQPLRGLRIMLNLGATREAIDCMRFLSNRSSGRMGYALALAAHHLGAQVTIIQGAAQPKELPAEIKIIHATSALEMLQVCRQQAEQHHVFFACAAVADYRPDHSNLKHKLKSDNATLELTLVKNPDIVQIISKEHPALQCIAFAAESDDILMNAKLKLQKKCVTAIIANKIGENLGVETEQITAWLLTNHSKPLAFKPQTKQSFAYNLLKACIAQKIFSPAGLTCEPINA